MNAYYIHSPRNFRNEYTVYVVECGGPVEERLKDCLDVERITRQEAIRKGIRLPRWANRTDGAPQWYGGFPGGTWGGLYDGGAPTDGQIIAAAKRATEEEVRVVEDWQRDFGPA